MTNRELSEKLYSLARQLEEIASGNVANTTARRTISEISDELYELSDEKYSPGSTSWNDIKPPKKAKKQSYINTAGKKLPF